MSRIVLFSSFNPGLKSGAMITGIFQIPRIEILGYGPELDYSSNTNYALLKFHTFEIELF
jgi:hypothetical protein